MNVPPSSQPFRRKQPAPHRRPLEPAEPTPLAPEPPLRRGGTRFRRGMILGIFMTVLFLLLLQILPDYLLKELLLHRVQKQLGQPVTAEHVSVSLIPPIRLSVVNVAGRSADSSADVFRADRIDVTLSVSSWLRGGGAVEQLLIEAPWIVVRRDEHGHWSIPLLSSMDRTRVAEARVSDPPTLPVVDLQVTKGTISLVDEFTRDGPKSRELTGVQAWMTVDQSSQRAEVNVSAVLPSTSQLSTISLVGVVIPVAGEHPGTRLASPWQFSGAVQAGGIELREVAAVFLPRSTADALPGTAHIAADVLLAPRQGGHELVVQTFSIESGALMLTGSANLAGLGTETTNYALTVASRPVTIQQLLHEVPVDWIPLSWQIRIAEDKPGGTLTLLGATVTSSGVASSQPEWRAEAMLTNGALIVGSSRTPIRDVSARIILNPEQLGVTEVHASSDGVQVTEATAVVSDLRDSPTIDLTAAGNADAKSLIRLLSAAWPAAGASEALSGVEEVDGNLDLWIHAAGPLKDSGIQLIKGRVEAQELTFRASPLPLPVRQLSGQVVILPGRVEIEKLRWRLGAVPVEASGRIDLAKTARFDDVELLVDMGAREFAAQLAGDRDGPFQTESSGPIHLRTTLSGPLTAPQIAGLLDLQDVELHTHGLHKRAGIPTAVEFRARLSPTNVLEVQKIDVKVPPARVTARGSARLGDQPSFDGTIHLQPTAIGNLPPGFALGPVTAGTVSATMRVKGASEDWTAWAIDGWMKLADGTVTLSQVKYPFRDLAVDLAFNDDTVRISQAGFTAGDSTVRTSGTITRWRGAPSLELEVVSPNLNLDLLSPNASPEGKTVNEPSSWLRAVTVTASMKIERARYQQLELTDVRGRVLVTDGLLRLDGITADTKDGTFTGQFTGRWPEGTAPTVEGFSKVTGVPVDHVLGLFGRENRLKGRLSVDGGMRAEEAGPHIKESLTSLNDIRVLIEDGRIYQSPIIGKMLKLVNLPALVGNDVDLDRDGIPFRRISGVFAVEQGLVTVKELYLDGPVLRISGAGSYDAVADRLELAMAMNPLQSYSTLLGKIPLIGRLLSGKREGLGATLYEVTGPLENPNVRMLPAESIGGGVSGFARLAYDILVNAAKLPSDLLTTPGQILKPEPN